MPWSATAHGPAGPLLQHEIGLYDGCLGLSLPTSRFGRAATPATCMPLTAAKAEELFSAMGSHSPHTSANLLVATRILMQAAVAVVAASLISTTLQAPLRYYHRAWAIVPLSSAVVSLTLTILALAFWGGVAKNGMRLGVSELAQGKIASGWVLALLSAIFGGLPIVSSIVDLAIPHRAPAAGAGGALPPALASATDKVAAAAGRGAAAAESGWARAADAGAKLLGQLTSAGGAGGGAGGAGGGGAGAGGGGRQGTGEAQGQEAGAPTSSPQKAF
jgi:hypothetical protein